MFISEANACTRKQYSVTDKESAKSCVYLK